MDEFVKLLEKNWSKIQANESDNVFALLFEFFYSKLLIEDASTLNSAIEQLEQKLKLSPKSDPKLIAFTKKHGENFAYDVLKLVSHFMVSVHQLKSQDSPFVSDAITLQLTQFYLGTFTLQGNTDIDKEPLIKKRYRKLASKFHPDHLSNNAQLKWLEAKDRIFGFGKSFQLLEDCKQLVTPKTSEEWENHIQYNHPQLLSFFRENQSSSSRKKVQQAFNACLLSSLTSNGENNYAVQTQACLLKQCLSSSYCEGELRNCNLTLDFALNEVDKHAKLCTKIFENYSEALQAFFPDLDNVIQQIYKENSQEFINEESINEELTLATEKTLFLPLTNALTTEGRAISYNLALLKLLFKPLSQYHRSEHINWLTQVISENKLCDWLDNFAKQIKVKKAEKHYTDIEPSSLESIIKEKRDQASTLTEKLFLSSFLDIIQNFQQSSRITEELLSPRLSKIIPFLTASISTTVLVTMYSNEIALLYSISYLCLRSRNSVLQSIGKNLALLTSSGLLLSFDLPLRTITGLNTSINFTATAYRGLLQFDSPQQLAIPRDTNTGRLNLYTYKNPIITTILRPLEEYVRHIQEEQMLSSWRRGGLKANKIQKTINSIREIDANSEILLEEKLNLIEKKISTDLVEDKTVYARTAKETIDLSLKLLIESKKALQEEFDSIAKSGSSLITYTPKPHSEFSNTLSEPTIEYAL